MARRLNIAAVNAKDGRHPRPNLGRDAAGRGPLLDDRERVFENHLPADDLAILPICYQVPVGVSRENDPGIVSQRKYPVRLFRM